MNTPTLTPPAGERQIVPAEHELNRLQREAAEKAATLGEFRSGFHERVGSVLGGDGASETDNAPVDKVALKREALARGKVIDDATKSIRDLSLEALPPNVLGNAHIGGGRGSINMAEEMLANVADEKGVKQVQQAAGHELGHARAVQLTGNLYDENGEPVPHLLIHEGYAEISGNSFVGMGINEYRDGQPAEVYNEGQTFIVSLLSSVSRSELESVMTGDGDLDRLQEKIDGGEQNEELRIKN